MLFAIVGHALLVRIAFVRMCRFVTWLNNVFRLRAAAAAAARARLLFRIARSGRRGQVLIVHMT